MLFFLVFHSSNPIFVFVPAIFKHVCDIFISMVCSASFENFSMILSNFCVSFSLLLHSFHRQLAVRFAVICNPLIHFDLMKVILYTEYKASSTDPKFFQKWSKCQSIKQTKKEKEEKSQNKVKMKMMWKVIKTRPWYSSQMWYTMYSSQASHSLPSIFTSPSYIICCAILKGVVVFRMWEYVKIEIKS